MSFADSLSEFDDRRQTHRIYWPTLLGSAFLAAVVPWYLGDLQIDLRPALKILLGGGVISVLLLHLEPKVPRFMARVAPYFASVVLLDAVWFALGTFDVPSFLLLLALPVFSAALVSDGWLEYVVAAMAIVASTVTAFFSDPMFRWYVERLDGFPDVLRRLEATVTDAVRLGASIDGHDQSVALASFSVTIFAVAMLGSATARVIRRQDRRLELASRARRETEELTSTLLDQAQEPELLVSASGRILSGNPAFVELVGEIDGASTVFGTLQPQYPEDFQRLIDSEAADEAPARVCRPSGAHRIFDIAVHPLHLDGEPAKRIRLRETASADLAVAALGAFGVGVLILDPDRRVRFVSAPFLSVFPLALVGAHADTALNACNDLPSGWWDIAPSRKAGVRFTHANQAYSATLCLSGTHAEIALTFIHLTGENRP